MKDDMNKMLNYAFNKIETPNNIDSILSDCKTQKRSGIIENDKKTQVWHKGFALALASLLFISTIGLNFLFNPNQSLTTIAFDVNPSIEIEINKNDEITKVNAINEDAVRVLDGMNLKGVELNVAVNALIGSMIKHGYINELANSILISVDSDDIEKENNLQNQLMEEIGKMIQSNNFEGAILTQSIDKDDQEIEELSNTYGITKSKAQLIKQIISMNNLHTFEDLVSLSINELNLISESVIATSTSIHSSGKASDKKYIGNESALDIVLKYVNLSKDKIRDLDIELDYENNVMVYEVEFEYNNQEYDYDVHAIDGSILHSKQNETRIDNSNTDNNQSTKYLSKEKVKQIAFNHIHLKENQVNNLWIELDSDEGIVIYEIDFTVDHITYEFEIDAITGKIIDYEKEIDD